MNSSTLGVLLLSLSLLLGCAESEQATSSSQGSTSRQGSDAGGGETGSCSGKLCVEDNQDIRVEPSELLFADLAAGTEQTLQLRLLNTGGRGELTVQSPVIEPTTTEFFVDNPSGENISPGQHVVWKIRFKPELSGAKSSFLVISNNSTEASKRERKIPLRVKAGVGALQASPDPVAFGAVPSLTAVTKTLAIQNRGDKPIKIDSLTLVDGGSTDFKIGASTEPPFDLAPKQALQVDIEFKPSNGGIDATYLKVGHSNGEALFVEVSGREQGPVLTFAPAALDFDAPNANVPQQTRSLTLINDGVSDLAISTLAWTPADGAGDLTLSTSGPLTLASHQTKVVEVTYSASDTKPWKPGQLTQLALQANDPNGATRFVPVRVHPHPCAATTDVTSSVATPSKGQVDIVAVVDSSAPMKTAKKAVADNLAKLVDSIEGAGVSPRVILIGAGLCVSPPLAEPGCSASARFLPIDADVDGQNALEQVVSTYPRWRHFLRAGAQRHFVMFTADKSARTAAWFQAEVAKLKRPGFPGLFTFHAVTGWSDSGVAGVPCFGAAAWPADFVTLAQSTGGLLSPICAPNLVPLNWMSLFEAIASKIALKVEAACTYDLPASANGALVNPRTVSLSSKLADGSSPTFVRARDAASCPEDGHAWHFDNQQAPGAAVLCAKTCEKHKGAVLTFHFGC